MSNLIDYHGFLLTQEEIKSFEAEMPEFWKDIEGFEGTYQVSSLGRVKSLKRLTKEYPKKGLRERIIKSSKTRTGYYIHQLCLNGIIKTETIHRLVAKAFIQNPENKPEVNHKFGIKSDNRFHQLEWSTCSENKRHAYKIGLMTPKNNLGEKNGNCKINESSVREIRRLWSMDNHPTLKQLADQFKVSDSAIFAITSHQNWKHVQ